jgi:hypothetical protein
MTHETKLFLNGARWWLRLPAPSATRSRQSTGTSDKKLAERIAGMVDNIPKHFILRVERGEVTLAELYDHWVACTLNALVASLDAAAVVDVDLDAHLASWHTEKARSKKGAASADMYLRQITTLYPSGTPFVLSAFTRREVRSRIDALKVDSPTKNRYKAAVSSFAKYLVLYDVLDTNFCRDIEGWGENDARCVYYLRAHVQQLLEKLPARYAYIAALGVGFGAEWSAIAAI